MVSSTSSQQWQEALGLEEQPVALAFLEQAPEGVPRSSEPSPSACTFWRRGQSQVFYADAEDHRNCPIGLMTMGFPMTAEQGQQANALVGTMASLNYFDPAEVAHVPGISKPHQVVVYGPLAGFPVPADLVLLMLDPYQAMLASEALGRVAWADGPHLGTFGRPACAALPMSAKIDAPTLSLGCIGARTYTDLPNHKMLLVVPGAQFEQATQGLATIHQANCTLADFHAGQRKAVAAL